MTDASEPTPRGRLKVFLGYAAGSGKTYQMLEEGQVLKKQGVDVVIGYFEPHGRKDTIARTENLEIIPRKKIEYRGATFEEMNTEEILLRKPSVCLVDEYAHSNIPGSGRSKRWEDVELLLDAGIDVYTTMNVQHLESFNDQIWRITGIRVRETIPDWVIAKAAEVVMVDVTPRALLNRLERGVVYPHDRAQKALQNFFKESTLVALREMALRQTAHEVDARQQTELHQEGTAESSDEIKKSFAEQAEQRHDRILVHITPDPATAALIRRAKRVADYLQAPCFAVYISSNSSLEELPAEERETIEKHLNFARNLHIETRILRGESAADTLIDFARLHSITQIFLARPRQQWSLPFWSKNFVQEVVRKASDMQITIAANRPADKA